MQATRSAKNNSLQFSTFSPDLIKWAQSDAGQMAMSSAIEESTLAVNNLSESRKIKPEQLHVPITL
jgi:hypothetical protein